MDIILHSALQLVDSMIQVAVHLSSHLVVLQSVDIDLSVHAQLFFLHRKHEKHKSRNDEAAFILRSVLAQESLSGWEDSCTPSSSRQCVSFGVLNVMVITCVSV